MTSVFDVRHYESLGSTNDEARRLADAGAAHGTVVAAREQTAGRGRVGRSWVSPPGNLYLSVLLRLDLPPARRAELSFVAALAVFDLVDAVLPGSRVMLKWPNDVLVEDAKISGILVEQADAATIVGIGVNVAHCPADTPYPATSLAEHLSSLSPRLRGERVGVRGAERERDFSEAPSPQPSPASGRGGVAGTSVEACRATLLTALATRLDTWLTAGFAPIRADWLARAHPIGTPLRAGQLEGTFAGLDPDGALLLDTGSGRRRIVAGDVILQPR